MSDYKVEKGIAIAPRKYENSKYPFGTMDIGESFRLAGSDSLHEYRRVSAAARYFSITHPPMKFAIRIDKSSGSYRCWRIG
jgi:hypothetical protein